MALNINTIKQASPKANNVATEQYVDTSIANIDVSGDINANNDIFAQRLGYANYAAMVNAATSGNTVIDGGYLNTGLINANAIVATQINTTGLIAENINASEIVGKTITGGVINGARINGAIIKASYLDLNGELEVLTNYIISLAMYNANPSLYTDAVYIEVDNEYRIPSLSVIKEPTTTFLISYADQSLIGTMKSYNTANVGHNLKAVKIRPQITVGSPQVVFSGSYDNIVSIDDYDGNLEKYFYIPGDAFTRSRGIYAEVWFAGIKLIEAGAVRTYGGHYSAAFVRNSVTGVDIRQGVSNVGITNTVTMSTAIFDFEVYWRVGEVGAMNVNSAVLQIKLLPSDKVLGFDWTSGNGIEIRNRTTNPASLGAPYSTNYGPYTANGMLGPTIFINNMI